MHTPHLHYFLRPSSHLPNSFDITLQITQNHAHTLTLIQPTWISGSYLIREYSRHVHDLCAYAPKLTARRLPTQALGDVSASNQLNVKIEPSQQKLTARTQSAQEHRSLFIEKIAKNRWQIYDAPETVCLSFTIYAHDLSVRGSWLEADRAFLNPVTFAIVPEDALHSPIHLTLEGFDESLNVATTLTPKTVDAQGFGEYAAASYHDFIERPIAIAAHHFYSFNLDGIPHTLALSTALPHQLTHEQGEQLTHDVEKICAAQYQFFDHHAPFSNYLFLLHIEAGQYGGLEHLDCTALLASPDMLPKNNEETSDRYLDLLGLFSHEYFHAWNVKHIRPTAFYPNIREHEGYSRLLWAFEGITSYYDDLFVLRAGIIKENKYLTRIAQTIGKLARLPARHRQTLEEASFDTWIKFYRPDENSQNANINYYLKGALAALALDLSIRERTQHTHSLDSILQALWRHARAHPEWTMAEKDWEHWANSVCNINLTDCFDSFFRSTDELPFEQLFNSQQLMLTWQHAKQFNDFGEFCETPPEPNAPKLWIGARLMTQSGGVKVETVFSKTPAQSVGLVHGDQLLALDGEKLESAEQFEQLLREHHAHSLHFFRRSRLMHTHIQAEYAPNHCAILSPTHMPRHVPIPRWPTPLTTL